MNVSALSRDVEPRKEEIPVSRPTHFSGGKGSNFHRGLAVLRRLAPYAQWHRRWFVLGTVAAIAVVASRLALPWPLRAVADLARGAGDDNFILSLAPLALDPVLAMGGIFFALIFALGLSDLLERLYFARFAIATVRDLRSDAIAAAVGMRTRSSGDVVSCLIGDSAKVKSGMQSFLVHVATNGLVFAGMTLILFAMDATLGLIFTLAGLATAFITVWAASRIFQSSLSHRIREGELAEQIQDALENDADVEIVETSGSEEARQTKLQGIATWTSHGIFGAAVLAALWVGARAVEAGQIDIGDLVVFMMYALMMRGSVVRLARQGAKTGKIFGAGFRLFQVFDERIKK